MEEILEELDTINNDCEVENFEENVAQYQEAFSQIVSCIGELCRADEQ